MLCKLAHDVDGQAHNVEIITLNARNPSAGKPLNGVCACLVVGLVGADVKLNVRITHRSEMHGGGGVRNCTFSVALCVKIAKRNAGEHVVRGILQSSDHAACIVLIARLSQNFAVQRNHGVGCNDQRVGLQLVLRIKQVLHVRCLLQGKLLNQQRGIGLRAAFVCVRGHNGKTYPQHFKDFLTAG